MTARTATVTHLPDIGSIEAPPAPSLRRKTVNATAWMVFGQVTTQGLRLVGNVVLAALLAPADFGLMALVTVCLTGLQLFSDTGIRPSIIQHARGDDPAFLNTAWTVQVVRGVLLSVACLVIAPFVAAFYERPELMLLLPVAGVASIFAGFNSTSLVTLNRHLDLGRVTLLNVGVLVVQIGVMILWARVYPTVWALVGGTLVGAACRTVASHLLLGEHRNRFHWDRESARALFAFGKWIFLGTIITFLGGQIDKLLLGKLVSTEVLGVYAIATVLALQPQKLCERLTSQVLLPVLSRVAREDRAALRDCVLRARRIILPAATLAVTAVVALAPIFFGQLYDARYIDAGNMARFQVIAVWFMVLAGSSSKALYATGDSRSVIVAGVARLIVGGVGCAIGLVQMEVVGFILGFAAGAIAGQVVIMIVMHRRGLGTVRQDVLFTTTASLAVGAAWLAPSLLGFPTGSLISLAPAVVILLLVTAWAWWQMRPVLLSGETTLA